MTLKPYTIVFSNYTAGLFAWAGTAAANKRYLANREVLGEVIASSEGDALDKWKAKTR